MPTPHTVRTITRPRSGFSVRWPTRAIPSRNSFSAFGGRKTGSKNRKTVEREKAKKIAALRAEIWKIAPPIDFKAPLDSLEVMEGVMRHFYLRAMTEQLMGDDADWNSVDALMLKVLAAAEKVARYRHAQLSAMRLSGDLNARPENVNLKELLESIRSELVTLGPHIGLDVENLLPAAVRKGIIELRNRDRAFAFPGRIESTTQLRPKLERVRSLARLDLGKIQQ
jgi:hypothetical protein